MNNPENPDFPEPQPGESGNPPRPPKKTARAMADHFPPFGSIIDDIAARMAARFPSADVKRGKDFIAYHPFSPYGFSVRLDVLDADAGYRLFYEGAWEDYTSRSYAILSFGYGLSTDCRLREIRSAGHPHRWVIEMWDDKRKRWDPDGKVGIWRRSNIRYLQNTLIDLRDEDSGFIEAT